MRDFRSIGAWHKAHELVLNIYKITQSFPNTEVYGLTSQIRRSAASIPANIAEGCGKILRLNSLVTCKIQWVRQAS